MGYTGHLLPKATLPRPGDRAALPKTQKQTQPKKKTKKCVTNERTEQSFRNRTKQNGDNLPDAEFQTLVIRMFSDLRENFNKEIGNITKATENIKKNQ